jgi:hypothetical protein
MVVGVNPVIQEVEAIAAPSVSTITLRSAWTGTGGTYSFLANQTSEGLRDAVQAIRTNNVSLQSFIDSIDTAATANSVAQRTSDGSINAKDVYASGAFRTDTTQPFGAVLNSSSGETIIDLNNTSTNGKRYFLISGGASGSFAGGKFGIFDATTSAPRFTLDSSGNVGIGTGEASITAGLQVVKGADTLPAAGASTAAACFGNFNSANAYGLVMGAIGATGNGYISAQRTDGTATTYNLLLQPNGGNVGIGVTNPTGSITDGNGVQFFSSGYLQAQRSNLVAQFVRNTSTGAIVQFGYGTTTTNGAPVGSISTDGSTVTYGSNSDYRLKEDWEPMDCACDRVMQLNPVNFAWKSSGKRVDGFLAHELAEVIPEAVTGEKDETRIEEYEVEPAVYEDVVIPAEFDEEGNEISPERTEQKLVKEAVMGEREVPEYQGIDQAKLVPLLTAALQDAIKKIEALEARIEALEG